MSIRKITCTLVVVLTLLSCEHNITGKPFLHQKTISEIAIRKSSDTVYHKLSTDQVDDFIGLWNRSEPKKAGPLNSEYNITIRFKSGEEMECAAAEQLIRHDNGQVYSLGDGSFMNRLWNSAAKAAD